MPCLHTFTRLINLPHPPLSKQGFIHAVTPLLHQRLANQADSLIGMAAPSAAAAAKGGSMTTSTPSSGEGGAGPVTDVLSSSIGSSAVQDSSVHITQSGRLTKLTSNRVNTDAMLQVLQQDIRQKGRRTSLGTGNELMVGEILGRGGFGVVYKGEWLGMVVRVRSSPGQQREQEGLPCTGMLALPLPPASAVSFTS
jgi:hypothetical protein